MSNVSVPNTLVSSEFVERSAWGNEEKEGTHHIRVIRSEEKKRRGKRNKESKIGRRRRLLKRELGERKVGIQICGANREARRGKT
jgi:hypothetical protein